MKFIVKLHPEIMIKSKSVRKRFSKMLQGNIRNVLRRHDETVRVMLAWDRIEVRSSNPDEANRQTLIAVLAATPGIVHFLEVEQQPFTDLHDIYTRTAALFGPQLAGKTFCVRVKRRGQHDYTSTEVERYVGGGLNQHFDSLGVRLKQPDLTIKLEIEQDQLFLVRAQHQGVGGFPIATQEDVLSLMSGGFDSGVASYMMIRRGCRTHYCFFNLGGAAHEIGVKQVAYYLWNKYGASHRIKFVSVPFEPVVTEILEKVENSQMGVILKRMMMRAASQVAGRMGIQALVTGESLGQVSSQTLTNLAVIDRVTDTLILRPLITSDKQDIINTARQIGTADFAETMPEYCGVISKKPTVKAVMGKIEEEEAHFDFGCLEQALAESRVYDIRDLAEEAASQVTEVESVSAFDDNEVVLDIRAPEEEEERPLSLQHVEVHHMPFYHLSTRFDTLDQSKTYLLYCDRGVMSKLQALYLREQGFTNVKVYRP